MRDDDETQQEMIPPDPVVGLPNERSLRVCGVKVEGGDLVGSGRTDE